MQEKEVTIEGIKVNYRQAGDKNSQKTVFVLHGWNQTGSKSWENVIEKLAKEGFFIIAPDMPGFGTKSSTPDKIWLAKDYSDFFQKFIKKLNLKKPILMGHSFGGAIVAYMTSENKDLTDKLFLVAPAIVREEKTEDQKKVEKMSKVFGFLKRLPLAKKLVYKLIGSKDYEQSSGMMRDIYHKIIRDDLTHILPKIETQTVLVWGDKDKMTPLRQGLIINEKLKNSKIIIIPNINHGVHLHAQEDLIKIVKQLS